MQLSTPCQKPTFYWLVYLLKQFDPTHHVGFYLGKKKKKKQKNNSTSIFSIQIEQANSINQFLKNI